MSEATKFNNPAFRLFTLLTELQNSPGNVATIGVLAGVFGVDAKPKAVFHAVVEFHKLVQDVLTFATQKTSLPMEPLKRYIPQIESAVNFTNLDAPWSQYAPRIKPECLLVLEMVAHVDGIVQDSVTSTEELKSLQAALTGLFELVASDQSLDKEFRTFMLVQIEKLRRCLAEYRISGAQGFVEYVEGLMVQTAKHSEVLKKATVESPRTFLAFKNVLGLVTKVVKHTESGIALLKRGKKAYDDGALLLDDLTNSSDSAIPELNGTDMA